MFDKISIILIDDNPPHHLRFNEKVSNDEQADGNEQVYYNELINYNKQIGYDKYADYDEQTDYSKQFRYNEKTDNNKQICDVNIPSLDPRPEFSKFFDLKWFSSIVEVREYRDSIRKIAYKSPTTLTKEKLIGEIICFDYAMTKDTRSVSERYDDPKIKKIIERLSLLPVLLSIRERLGITLEEPCEDLDLKGGGNNDDQGCIAGGLLFSLLADYPCAPVALTVKEDYNISSAAKFFEWMLENDAHHAFKNKGRPDPQWDELIFEGVQTLRKRIEELATAGIIHLNLDDLMKLAEPEYRSTETDSKSKESESDSTELKPNSEHNKPTLHETLTFHSRYGMKTLPVNGLFIDTKENERVESARTWAKSLLEKLLGDVQFYNIKINDLKMGMEFADRLFDAYTNLKLRKQRHFLSEALTGLKNFWLNDSGNNLPEGLRITIKALGDGDETKGNMILKKYMREHISHLRVTVRNKDEKPFLEKKFQKYWKCSLNNNSNELKVQCMSRKNCLSLGSKGYTDIQKRWAVLFMIVKLHRFRWIASRNYIKYVNEQNSYSTQLIEKYDNRDFMRNITYFDLYDALYPLPGTPLILPLSEGADADVASSWKDARSFGGQATRNGKKSTYGKLSLKFKDLLESKNWTDDPEYPNNTNADHGFMKGERTILIMYANSFNDWDWEKNAPSLLAILKPEE